MRMSLKSRREYLGTVCQRYHKTSSRREKSRIIDEIVSVLGYHRKYAVQVLNGPIPTPKPPIKRHRPIKYLEALPVIQLVWEALDFPCAERLQPVLRSTATVSHPWGTYPYTRNTPATVPDQPGYVGPPTGSTVKPAVCSPLQLGPDAGRRIRYAVHPCLPHPAETHGRRLPRLSQDIFPRLWRHDRGDSGPESFPDLGSARLPSYSGLTRSQPLGSLAVAG